MDECKPLPATPPLATPPVAMAVRAIATGPRKKMATSASSGPLVLGSKKTCHALSATRALDSLFLSQLTSYDEASNICQPHHPTHFVPSCPQLDGNL